MRRGTAGCPIVDQHGLCGYAISASASRPSVPLEPGRFDFAYPMRSKARVAQQVRRTRVACQNNPGGSALAVSNRCGRAAAADTRVNRWGLPGESRVIGTEEAGSYRRWGARFSFIHLSTAIAALGGTTITHRVTCVGITSLPGTESRCRPSANGRRCSQLVPIRIRRRPLYQRWEHACAPVCYGRPQSASAFAEATAARTSGATAAAASTLAMPART
jgi:hypothetical protein